MNGQPRTSCPRHIKQRELLKTILILARFFDKIVFCKIAVEFHINGHCTRLPCLDLSRLMSVKLSSIDHRSLINFALLKSQYLSILTISAPDLCGTAYL